MSNYSKTTDFAAKDSLPTGNPSKIVKGTEINDEFAAIQTAVNSKADTNNAALTGSPTAPTAVAGTNNTEIATTAFVATSFAPLASPALTGTPTAPTATLGTDTTQIATTAFVQAALEAVYPVGSVYVNASDATNPATLLGFGTWTAFGAGKVPVGIDSGDTDFDTAEETGGVKEVTLTSAQSALPSHTHYAFGDNGDGTTLTGDKVADTSYDYGSRSAYSISGSSSDTADRGITSAASASASEAHTNLQPYIVVHMWKRTA